MQLVAGDDVLLTFASVIAALMVWRELRWWWRLPRWKRAEGKVVGFDKEDGLCPLVEFQRNGETSCFLGYFALFNPAAGETVPVVYDPDSKRAKIYTLRHRWFPTALMAFCIIGCLTLAWLSP